MKSFIRKLVVRILTWEAKCVLKKYHPHIVGVTGNVGKTSTKDTIAAVLETGFLVRKSEKSYNSEIGLPLTILGLHTAWNSPLAWTLNIINGFWQVLTRRTYAEWLVLELGVAEPGDMASAVSWLQLDVAVMTGMSSPPVHAEFFGGAEQLYAEKAKILDGLREGGIAIVNYDDKITMGLAMESGKRIISYGTHKGAGILAGNIHLTYRDEGAGNSYPEGLTFKMEYQGKSLPVRLPGVVGKNMVYAALAAMSVGLTQKLNVVEMIAALATAERPRGRLRLLRGMRGTILLDDTYNSSPTACKLALETLHDFEAKGRRVVIMGDMLELGEASESAHRDIGEEASKVADFIILVGSRARMMGEGALDAGYPPEKIIRFADSKIAATKIPELIAQGDLVLIKGSQGARTERIVKVLIAEPSRASELLVRQEKVWQNR